MEIFGERYQLDPAERATFDAPGECEGAGLDVDEAFGAHDIEYWVRSGNRLVPATGEDIAQIQQWERELTAHLRLQRWRRDERRRRAWPMRLLRWVLTQGRDRTPQAPPRADARVTSR